MKPVPELINNKRIPISDPLFKKIIEYTGWFHDSNISESHFVDNVWMIRLGDVYFPSEKSYNVYDIRGCIIILSNCTIINSSILVDIIGRDIFELDIYNDSIHIIFSFDGYEISGVKFDPYRSHFEWIFD